MAWLGTGKGKFSLRCVESQVRISCFSLELFASPVWREQNGYEWQSRTITMANCELIGGKRERRAGRLDGQFVEVFEQELVGNF